MRIVSKYKDYYDWAASGVMYDETVVFDRRNAADIRSGDLIGIMDKIRDYHASHFTTFGSLNKKRWTVVEIGKVRYLFCIRYKQIPGYIVTDCVDLVSTARTERKTGSAINIYENITGLYFDFQYGTGLEQDLIHSLGVRTFKNPTNKDWLPIFEGTFIPRFISAEEVATNIYEFLCSQKDIDIPNTQCDKDKAVSHGFDVKTSFRNMKR